jgi:hypothetical protein
MPNSMLCELLRAIQFSLADDGPHAGLYRMSRQRPPLQEVVSRAETMSSIMTAGKFLHLRVVEDGQLVSIVSIGDVVKTPRPGNRTRIRNLARLRPHRLG